MQDLHTVGFEGGIFHGRMNPHPHQPIKCPRCDSINTKFCYYNNYNFSQPRHFCKTCRRYWTKGGVLRSVPVGGGCRKSKRSRHKSSATTVNITGIDETLNLRPAAGQQEVKSNSHSSSESSSLTVTPAHAASATTLEAMSAPAQKLAPMHEPKFFINSQNGISNLQSTESGIFSEIGRFPSLIASTRESLAFGFGSLGDSTPFPFNQLGNDHLVQTAGLQEQNLGLKQPEIAGGSMLSETVDGGFEAPLDWQGLGDQCLFDLPNPNNLVHQIYWTQNHCGEPDHTSLLYLP